MRIAKKQRVSEIANVSFSAQNNQHVLHGAYAVVVNVLAHFARLILTDIFSEFYSFFYDKHIFKVNRKYPFKTELIQTT